jgi:O-antigen/teichoic acid export membrane protein
MYDKISRNQKSYVLRGSVFVLIAILIVVIIDYLSKIFIATTLAPISFGEFSVVISLGIWASSVSLFGMNDASIKKLSENSKFPENKNSIICTAVIFLLIFVCLVSGGLFLLLPLFTSRFNMGLTITLWIPIISAVESFREIFNAFMRGFRKFEFLGFTQVLNSAVFFTLVVVFFYYGWGIIGAFLGMICAMLLTILLQAVFLVTKLQIKFVKPQLETFKILFSFGKLTYASYFLEILRRNALIVLLVYLWGSYFVGIFSAASILSGILAVAGVVISTVLFPSISNIQERSIVQEIYSEGFQHTMFFIGLMAIGLIFYASDFIRIFLGMAYFMDFYIQIVFSILCVATVIIAVLAIPESISLGLGRPDLKFWSIFVGGLVTLILGYVLITLFSYIGAAITYLISFLISMLFLIYSLKKKESLYIKTKKLYPIIAGLSVMVVINIVGRTLYPAFSIPVMVISLLLFFLINLKERVLFDEINFLKTILRSILDSYI